MLSSKYLVIFGLLFSFCCYNRVEGKLDFVKGLANLAEAVGNLIQVSDDCKYTCRNGATPKENPEHKKTANGCGSYGTHFKIGAVPGATECCNKHDYCYDTCNSDKAFCDRQLEHCLQKICYNLKGKITDKKEEECVTVVQYIFGGVSALGCEAYLKSQKSACTCY
ncbi:hypothetical protein LSH36_624g01093 [Paralvinella palmiformis]|uniref:Uncharacterized protein n=1 Tax=Paralvinella palmiformis TaxID=53620 RepID=A0AAD9MX40_9ANNE|nr:hypothetical protein LSH36_624g01093 [Paralvinella palmiformis]